MNRARALRANTPMDLSPIMGLVAILIPLLLMAYRPAELAMIESMLPGICSGDCSGGDPDPLIITPSLAITRSGFTLTGLQEVEGLELDEQGKLDLPCEGGSCSRLEDYDTHALTQALSVAKDAYPDSTAITLVPDGRVAYEVLIAAMDASRAEIALVEGAGERELFPHASVAGGVQ